MSPTHGIPSTYKSPQYACRCDLCREANRLDQRRQAAKRKATRPIPPHVKHGSMSTYSNWGCRCAACTKANTVQCAAYQKRIKAEAAS
jgi:hypothetical protein